MTRKKACIMLLVLVCAWNTNLFYAEEISDSTLNYELIHEGNDSFKIQINNTNEIKEAIETYKKNEENSNIIIEYNDISADISFSYELTDEQMDELLSKDQVVITLDDVIKGNIYRVYLKLGDQIIHQLSEEDIINTSVSEEQLEDEYIRIGTESYTREVKTERSATCDIEQMKKVAEAGDIFDGAGCSYIVTEDTELPFVDTNTGTIKNMNITFASGVAQDTDAILARTNAGLIENVIINKPMISLVDNGSFGAVTNQNNGMILNSRVEDADITVALEGSTNNVSACLATVTNGDAAFIINDDEYESANGDYTGSVKITPESRGSRWYVSTTRLNKGYIIGTDALIDGTINESTYFSQIAITNDSYGEIANTKVRGYVENEESKLNLDQKLSTKVNNSDPLYVYSGVVVGNNIGTIKYQDDVYISNIEVVKLYKNTAGILVAVNDGTIELDKDVYIRDISGTENAIYDGFGVITGENSTGNDIVNPGANPLVTVYGDVEVKGVDLTTIGADSMHVGSLVGSNKNIVEIGGNIKASDINMTTGDYSGGLFGWSAYIVGPPETTDNVYIEVGGYIDMNNININGNGEEVGGVIGSEFIRVLGSQEMPDGESAYTILMQNSTISGMEDVGGIIGEANPEYAAGNSGLYFNNVTVTGNNNIGGVVGKVSGQNISYYGVQAHGLKVTGDANVGGVVGNNEHGKVEYITIVDSEVTGTNAVGAIAGENSGTISGASIASDVQVIGNERVGTLVGLNEGTVDHSFSSGNIYNQSGELIDSNQREYTNNYVGTLVGQQVNGASLKQSVYDGASYSNSIYREVGVQYSLEGRANRVNSCVEKNYQVNPTMTIGDYDQLVSAGGECEQEELDNGERRDNYIADDEFVYTAGDEYQVCVFTYYADKKNTMPASFTPECEEDEKSLPPVPIRYQAYLRIWVGTEIYELWHVDKPTSENYSGVRLQETISGNLDDSDIFGFGDCWNKSVYPPQLYPYGSEELCNISMS